jgi:hypothetical protein
LAALTAAYKRRNIDRLSSAAQFHRHNWPIRAGSADRCALADDSADLNADRVKIRD